MGSNTFLVTFWVRKKSLAAETVDIKTLQKKLG
jgi:hypothetical protein